MPSSSPAPRLILIFLSLLYCSFFPLLLFPFFVALSFLLSRFLFCYRSFSPVNALSFFYTYLVLFFYCSFSPVIALYLLISLFLSFIALSLILLLFLFCVALSFLSSLFLFFVDLSFYRSFSSFMALSLLCRSFSPSSVLLSLLSLPLYYFFALFLSSSLFNVFSSVVDPDPAANFWSSGFGSYLLFTPLLYFNPDPYLSHFLLSVSHLSSLFGRKTCSCLFLLSQFLSLSRVPLSSLFLLFSCNLLF